MGYLEFNFEAEFGHFSFAAALILFTKSVASSLVKLPEICTLPLVIGDWMVGMEVKWPSITIAKLLCKFCCVIVANCSDPLLVSVMSMSGRPKESLTTLADFNAV